MKATLVDVLIAQKGVNERVSTTVGVVEGGWQDWMLDTVLDRDTFFWFDNLDDIVVGADMGDDVIIEIQGEPYVRTENRFLA